jgi:hypothetical protein
MALDREFADYLERHGYHPRSSNHSDYLSFAIIAELISRCPLIRDRALTGQLVARLRHHQQVGHADWVIDIAFGRSSEAPAPPDSNGQIRFAVPSFIQIAIELKSIITEHGKARRNRLRDFSAFHAYAHAYSPTTIAAAFLAINSSEQFYSPLRRPDDITHHSTPKKTARVVAREALDLFRALPLRHQVTDGPGLEAIGVIVVEHDNLNIHPEPTTLPHRHQQTRIAPSPPSVPAGDSMHYNNMLDRICMLYTQRFA